MKVLAFATGLLAAGAACAATADWRDVDPENALLIETTKGKIIVEMAPEAAPKHVEQIKALARKGVYDGNTFFRVIDRFMAQTGDPKNTGEGGSDLPNLKAEFTFRRGPDTPFVTAARPMGLQLGYLRTLPVISQDDSYRTMTSDKLTAAWGTYCPGVAGMARDDDPDSANSQFFIQRQAYPSLDKRYTVWGRALTGLDVVRAIKTGEPVEAPDKMTRVRVLADVPAAERPTVRIAAADGPTAAALIAKAKKAKGADFSLCDVDFPVDVRWPKGG